MYKKSAYILTIVILLMLNISTVSVSATETYNPQNCTGPNRRECLRKQFEERLKLTDKQKVQARAIHQKGREEMKPVIELIAVKRKEIETLKLTRMAERAIQEQTAQLNQEIKDLEKQAQEIRKKNSQEFEAILTKKQKSELALMKAEGRAKFEQNHPARAPFQGLGTTNFLFKPLVPLQNEGGLFSK